MVLPDHRALHQPLGVKHQLFSEPWEVPSGVGVVMDLPCGTGAALDGAVAHGGVKGGLWGDATGGSWARCGPVAPWVGVAGAVTPPKLF